MGVPGAVMRAAAAAPAPGMLPRHIPPRRRPTLKEAAAMELLAATFTVAGAHGWLVLIAAVLFGVAAILAWFIPPHKVITVLFCAGLCLWALSQLWA